MDRIARVTLLLLGLAIGTSCKSNQVIATNAVCEGKFQDCDRDPANACESNTELDLKNCGACGAECPSQNGTATCVASLCKLDCWSGFADCDGNPANGCETNLATSLESCGVCGSACGGPNAKGTCVGGVCQLACEPGFGDCNKNPADGCEQELLAGLDHCGACGKSCRKTGTVTKCNAGTCEDVSCETGFHDCSGVCSANDAPATCGTSCTPCAAPTGGMGTCTSGTCGFACIGGRTACGSECIDLATASDNCGACGRSCGGSTCAAGLCAPKALATVTSPFPEVPRPGLLSNSTNNLWWYAFGTTTSSVYRLPKTGGTPELFVTTSDVGVFASGSWVATGASVWAEGATAGSVAARTLAGPARGVVNSEFVTLLPPTSLCDGAWEGTTPTTGAKRTLFTGLCFNCGTAACQHAFFGGETAAAWYYTSNGIITGAGAFKHARVDTGPTTDAGRGSAFAVDATHSYRTGYTGTTTTGDTDLYRRKLATDVDELVLKQIGSLEVVGADARGTYFVASVVGAITSKRRAVYRIDPGGAVSSLKAIYTGDLGVHATLDSTWLYIHDQATSKIWQMKRPD